MKWILFGGYNPRKENTYNNILILGDFNSQTDENIMNEFCQTQSQKLDQ